MEPEDKIVTIKEQRAHIRKIKRIADKLIMVKKNNSPVDKHYLYAFTEDEIDTLESALACHWCAIQLNIENRKKEEKQ